MPASISAAGLRLLAHPRDPTTTVPQRAKKDESCGSAHGPDVERRSRPKPLPMTSNKCNRKTHDVTIRAYHRLDGVVASCGSCVVTLVKAMRIPCFGRRMTIGRASIVWPVSR
jgi:hypothetical protein